MATIDIDAPDVRFRQKSRGQRERDSRQKRAVKAADNPYNLMTVPERQAERMIRQAQAPQVRASRMAARKTAPPPLRAQVERLQAQVESLGKQLVRK